MLTFIRTSGNPRGMYGAIYCLHLIGIDSRIAGRYYEEFSNPKARAALVSLLTEQELQPVIMELLIRDPW